MDKVFDAGAASVEFVESMSNTQEIQKVVSKFEVCIHAASGSSDDVQVTSAILRAMQGPISIGKGGGPAEMCFSRKFIYTSGNLVCGEENFEAVGEDSVPISPYHSAAWRSEVEEMVVDADTGAAGVIISESYPMFTLQTAVIRPGFVYGGTGSGDWLLRGMLATALEKGASEVFGDGSNRLPIVHVDDAATLFVAVLAAMAVSQSLSSVGVFHAVQPVTPTTSTMNAIARACSMAAGAEGMISHSELPSPMFGLDQRLGCQKSLDLGWRPRDFDPSVLLAEYGLAASSNKGKGVSPVSNL
jgi:nucleoside-diphosphate-sugar epimerase